MGVLTYPVQLLLDGRPVLVVGGGRIAARKIAGLLDAGAQVTVVAPDVSNEVAGWADDRRVELWRRRYALGDAATFRLVITATGEPEVDAEVFTDAERHGIWVNSADDPEHCTFFLPAVVRRGSVAIGIGTGGASPALASWLRSRIADVLPERLDELVEMLARERDRVHRDGASTEGLDWGTVIEQFLGPAT